MRANQTRELTRVLFHRLFSTDIRRKVFILPQESATTYVSLIPQVKKPLQDFALCLKSFRDLTYPYSLYSFNTRDQDNELLLFVDEIEEYTLYIGNAEATSKDPPSSLIPQSICV